MTGLMHSVAAVLKHEFHNEIVLFTSLSALGQLVYGFYALAAVLVIRPHIRQAMKYRHGEAGKGDFCHRAQYEAIFWRLAPLFYAFVINSKLLALSVLIDIVGRLWTIRESHRAEKRFIGNHRAAPLRQNAAGMDGVDSPQPEQTVRPIQSRIPSVSADALLQHARKENPEHTPQRARARSMSNSNHNLQDDMACIYLPRFIPALARHPAVIP